MINRIPIGRKGINYKQHEVYFGDGCLLLRDHREVEEAPGAVTVEHGAVTRANVADAPFPDAMLAGTTPISDPLHVVCHLTEYRKDVNFLDTTAPGAPKLVILQVSAGADHVPLPSEFDNHAVWLSMASRSAYVEVNAWLSQFLDLSFEDARKLATLQSRSQVTGKLEYLEGKYSNFLNVILPGSVDAPLALRLLCEAWLLTNGASSRDENGIMIHAPQKLDDWLTPFATDDKVPTKEFVIAAMDKSQRDTVVKIFDAVSALESAVGEESIIKAKGELASAIGNLIKPTSES